ncbi:MAG: response regulator transcription factor [Rhodospirillaceae bacterium]
MASGKSLLLIQGDQMLRRALVDHLGGQGDFETIVESEDGASGVSLAKAKVFDMILLDSESPDIDGRDVCEILRDAGIQVPIIMLMPANSEDGTADELDAGASDYVKKPFRMAVLLARVRDHLRQHIQSGDVIVKIGPYKFQPAAKILFDEETDNKIRLTEKENAILRFFIDVGNKTVSREKLLDEVWGYNAGITTHTLETHVYRLRQKIEADPSNAQILITEPGGYRLNP